MVPGVNLIIEELNSIKEELRFIKKHMVDADVLLGPEEEERLNLSLKEQKERKTVSLKDLKKELGV